MLGNLATRLIVILAIGLTIGCDRVTKHIAEAALAGTAGRSYLADTIRVTFAENRGGFLGAGADMAPPARILFFTVATGLALVALMIAALRRKWNTVAALGLTMFIAGGASNWYDRVARGSVIDFLNVGVGTVRTGIFNVADVAIMCGAALFMLAELRRKGLPIEFREFQPEERDACLALFDGNSPGFFAANEREDYAAFLAAAGGTYRVCLIDGRVIGAYGLEPSPAGAMSLRWILLSPDAQGRGVGTAVMARVLAELRAAGVTHLHIAASHKSATFFARFGATEVSTTPDGWGPGMHRVDMVLIAAAE